MSSTKVSLKLLIDKSTQKVLFAEASKDFIDFLFSLLSLPITTVTRLLTKNAMVGCLGKLYDSIENLNDTYFLNPSQDKDFLLKSPSTSSITPSLLMPVANDGNSNVKMAVSELYMCSKRCSGYYVTEVLNTACPLCYHRMSNVATVVGKKGIEVMRQDGFVQRIVTYMVMDDLVVQPMSTISCIAMMNKSNIKHVDSLQERVVELGMEEGIKLLKASLECDNALTTTFLKNMGA